MEKLEAELGTIRGRLAFHMARLEHVTLERGGYQADADLSLLLQRARSQFAEGSPEQRSFDQAAVDPWRGLRPVAEA